MEKVIIDTIKLLATKAQSAAPHEALHYSQAALNLSHVLQVISQCNE